MKITKNYLKQVIKEELESVLREEDPLNEGIKDYLKSKFGTSKNYDFAAKLKELFDKLKTATDPKEGFYNPELQKTGKKLYIAYKQAGTIKRDDNYKDTSYVNPRKYRSDSEFAEAINYIKYATHPKNYFKASPEERKKAVENIIRTTEGLFDKPIRSALLPGESTFHDFLKHASAGVTLKDAHEKEKYNKEVDLRLQHSREQDERRHREAVRKQQERVGAVNNSVEQYGGYAAGLDHYGSYWDGR